MLSESGHWTESGEASRRQAGPIKSFHCAPFFHEASHRCPSDGASETCWPQHGQPNPFEQPPCGATAIARELPGWVGNRGCPRWSMVLISWGRALAAVQSVSSAGRAGDSGVRGVSPQEAAGFRTPRSGISSQGRGIAFFGVEVDAKPHYGKGQRTAEKTRQLLDKRDLSIPRKTEWAVRESFILRYSKETPGRGAPSYQSASASPASRVFWRLTSWGALLSRQASPACVERCSRPRVLHCGR